MEYHFKIHKTEKGYWAECIELKGCHTQAATRKKLDKNMREALNLFLDEPETSSVIFPLPRKLKTTKMTVPVNQNITFPSR